MPGYKGDAIRDRLARDHLCGNTVRVATIRIDGCRVEKPK